ncbi:MAG: hypothetical protein OXG19_04610 [Chloroflexi bacterium]|nr:hypothetical protein [Chloroflexota bacterium]
MSAEARVRLVDRLLDTPTELQPGTVRMELFWRGLRDHVAQCKTTLAAEQKALAERYAHHFSDLRGRIEEFVGLGGFRSLIEDNYQIDTASQKEKLGRNLFHTEIDIVLESPHHLFIGEAKYLMSFHAHSDLILVHQLIRQYVMARILLDLRGDEGKKLVPFVVGENAKSLQKTAQVQFMFKQEWMRKENILEWSEIKALR